MSFEEKLSRAVSTLAVCWRLCRGDGVVLGFTSHDRELRVDGVTYRARPGMTPSAILQTDGLEGDSMAVEGALDAASITAADLAAGRWRGAVLESLVCDWSDPAAGALVLSRGRMGDVVRPCSGQGGAFRVELVSEAGSVDELLPLRLTPTCRNELGDGGCGVDLLPLRTDALLAGGAGRRLDLVEALPDPGRFKGGSARFLRGALSGLDRRIVSADGVEIVLEADVPAAELVGIRVRLTPGCDKRLSTCRDRFGNVAAFGGEPHVPGTDALWRYAQA